MRNSERRPSLLARLSLPLILLFCVVQSWRPLGAGFDFWAHAAIGRWIDNHGAIPKYGLFLWSAPHYAWVYHSWLSQWFFFKLLTLFGPVGVMAFTTAIVCLVFFLLWRFWQKRVPGHMIGGGLHKSSMPAAAPVLFFIAIFVSTARFVPRQEMLTALLLVVFLTWLTHWKDRRAEEVRNNQHVPLFDKKSLGILALFVLWINLHALVLFPLVLLWAAVVADSLQYRFDRRARALLLMAVLCSAATFCNPWGYGYWAAAEVLKSGSQAESVQEWWPVWRDWPAMQPFVIGEALLVLAALWSWAANSERRWAELLWLLGTTVLFVRSRRLLWILAIVCLIVLAANAGSFDSRALCQKWRARTKQPPQEEMPPALRLLAHGGILAILALTLVSFAQVFPQNKREFSPVRGVSSYAPERAAQYVLKIGVPPRIFADYEYSSYLHWRLNGLNRKGVVPDAGLHPLYIDLFNAYPDKAMDNYFQILKATPAGLVKLDRLGINTVILGGPHWHGANGDPGLGTRQPDKIAGYLEKSAAWKRVFSDANARIWVRRQPRRPATDGTGAY